MFKIHSATPHFKEMFAALQAMVEGPAEIEMYEEPAGLNR